MHRNPDDTGAGDGLGQRRRVGAIGLDQCADVEERDAGFGLHFTSMMGKNLLLKWRTPVSCDTAHTAAAPYAFVGTVDGGVAPSSVIVPVAWERANDPRAVCDRLLNVYDGDTRYDIQLNYKSTKPIRTDGYRGYAYVCSLRYIPVAGHKKKQRNIEYMSKNEDIEI